MALGVAEADGRVGWYFGVRGGVMAKSGPRALGDLPAHKKFGYEHAVEMAAIRAELVAAGKTGLELHFEAIREYDRRHENDPPFRERQRAWLARAKVAAPKPVEFTGEELARMAEHFAGANDPVAASIVEKALHRLET